MTDDVDYVFTATSMRGDRLPPAQDNDVYPAGRNYNRFDGWWFDRRTRFYYDIHAESFTDWLWAPPTAAPDDGWHVGQIVKFVRKDWLRFVYRRSAERYA